MLDLTFINPITSIFSNTDCIHIVIQQTRTSESNVLHTRLPNGPRTFLHNSKTTQSHENRVFFRLVYRIWRFTFIHYLQQTQFEPMKLQLLPLTKVPTLSPVQVLQQSSTHQQFGATRSPLICSNQRPNVLPSADSYAGAIMINPHPSFSCPVLRVS